MCVCVCVCACERERGKEREVRINIGKDTERAREIKYESEKGEGTISRRTTLSMGICRISGGSNCAILSKTSFMLGKRMSAW